MTLLFRVCPAVLLLLSAARGENWHAESAPEYDRLFQQSKGWIGADGDYTVALGRSRTLWLFSDTFLGEVGNGRRINSVMVNNTAGVQNGMDPLRAHVNFFHGHSPEGKPRSLFAPADNLRWYWLGAGEMDSGRLFIFLHEIEAAKEVAGFGFRQTGSWLCEVSNPSDTPTRWRSIPNKIPFAAFRPDESFFFGSAILRKDHYLYLYGIRERPGAGKQMILARVPGGHLGDFGRWRFYTPDGWDTRAGESTPLCSGMANEYSVSWLPSLHRYVLICTENGLSGNIIARTAPEPWGPWGAASVVYRCPEATKGKNIFCYAAKAHPMLTSSPDELIVTYAANSFDFARVLDEARLYWPRFVRLKAISPVR